MQNLANKATIRILDIVPQKVSGFTVVAVVSPEANLSSEEAWRTILPGSFNGATRVEKEWHFYYDDRPPFQVGDIFEID